MPVVRFCSREGVNEEMEDKKRGSEEGMGRNLREGVEGKGAWLPSLHCFMLPGQPQHVALSARLQSILCESLINEAGALGQPSHISASPGCAPPYLSFHVLSFAPYDTFLYDR